MKKILFTLLILTGCGGDDHGYILEEDIEAAKMAGSYVYLGTQYFANPTTGNPIPEAHIFVGDINQDPEDFQKQVTLVLQSGQRVQVSQPIRTSSGGTIEYQGSPALMTVEGNYSLKVLDANGAEEYYFAEVPESGISAAPGGIDSLLLIDGTSSNPSIGYQDHPGDGFYHDDTNINVKYNGKDSAIATMDDLNGASWSVSEIATAQTFTLAPEDDGTHFILTGAGTYGIQFDTRANTPWDGFPRVRVSINNPNNDTSVNFTSTEPSMLDRDYNLSADGGWVEFNNIGADLWRGIGRGFADVYGFGSDSTRIEYDQTNEYVDFIRPSDGEAVMRLPTDTAGFSGPLIFDNDTDELVRISAVNDFLYPYYSIAIDPDPEFTDAERRTYLVNGVGLSINIPSGLRPVAHRVWARDDVVTITSDPGVFVFGLDGTLLGDENTNFAIPKNQLWEFETAGADYYSAYRIDTPSVTALNPPRLRASNFTTTTVLNAGPTGGTPTPNTIIPPNIQVNTLPQFNTVTGAFADIAGGEFMVTMSVGLTADWAVGDVIRISHYTLGSHVIIAEWVCDRALTSEQVFVSGTYNTSISAVSTYFQISVTNAAATVQMTGQSAYNRYSIIKIAD